MTENDAIEELKFNNEKCLEQCEGACFSRKNNDCACQDAVIERMLDELLQYRAIGTAEECRKAVEKQKPKKPHRNYKKFSGLWCKCGWYLGQKQCLDIKYCPNCGQAIDENLEGIEDE